MPQKIAKLAAAIAPAMIALQRHLGIDFIFDRFFFTGAGLTQLSECRRLRVAAAFVAAADALAAWSIGPSITSKRRLFR